MARLYVDSATHLPIQVAWGAPAKVSVVGLSQIVFAMALDVGVLGNSFNWMTLLGICLVVAPTTWLLAYPALRQAREELPPETGN